MREEYPKPRWCCGRSVYSMRMKVEFALPRRGDLFEGIAATLRHALSELCDA